MRISSGAFREGGGIPRKYTCDGDNTNPPLQIWDVPKHARSLALIMEDPDAMGGTFTHWILFNILPETNEILECPGNTSPILGTSGMNDSGTTKYFGPCPPMGVHRYIITLYALDTELKLVAGATKSHLIQEMVGHVISEARLMCTYLRAQVVEEKKNVVK